MMGQLSIERMQRLDDISWKYFNWEDVVANCEVGEIQEVGDNQLLMCCPLHEDVVPSFRVRKNLHQFHCFACNAAGSILKLMYLISGQSVNQSVFYEQVLQRTPAMQAELGFTSIFIDSKSLDPQFNKRRVFSSKTHLGSGMPMSVFTQKMRKVEDSWRGLAFSLSLLQEGESREVILAKAQNIFVGKINSVEVKSKSSGESQGVQKISLASLLDDGGSDND